MTTVIPRRSRRGARANRTGEPGPVPPPAAVPLAHVTANLLPDVVLARRALRHLRRRLVFGLLSLVLLIGLGYALTWQQTQSAQGDLAGEQQRIAALNSRVSSFAPVVAAQADIASIRTQLAGATADDLSWATLLDRLARALPGGMAVTALTGDVTGASTGTSTTGAVTVPDAVGTLTITGVTRDYRLVAQYADRLARIHGLTAVQPASVTGQGNGLLQYTIDLSFTKALLGGRFAQPATTTTPGGH